MNNELVTEFTKTQNDIAAVEAKIMEATAALQSQLTTLKEQDAIVRTAIKNAMEANNVKTFENDQMKITLVEASTRNTLDAKRLKEEAPGLYDTYVKETKVSASIRIKIK